MEHISNIPSVERTVCNPTAKSDSEFSDFTLYQFSDFHLTRFNKTGNARAHVDTRRDADPYLWILLADQEIRADRPEQAKALIEAAYSAYDQCRFGS